MAYILDGLTLAMEGQLAPVEPDGDYCLAPFALNTNGIVVLLVAEDEPVFNRGGGPDKDMVRRIQEQDELLFMVILAFLQIKDDW